MGTNKYAVATAFSLIDKATAPLAKIGVKGNAVGKQLKKDFMKAQDQLAGIGKAAKKAAIGIGAVGGAAVAAFAVKGVKDAIEFNTELTKIATVADLSNISLGDLGKKIMEISNTTGVSSSELAKFQYQVINSGIATLDSADYVAAAVKTSKAAFTDTGTVIDGLTKVMNAYQLEATQADKIAGQMYLTTTIGNASFEDLNSSLGKVLPTAARMNLKTDELFASIASLTANAVETPKAVKGIQNILEKVQNPTDSVSKAAKKLGIDFSAAALESKGLAGFLQEVQKKTGGSEKAIMELFGSVEALNAVNILTTRGVDTFNQALGEMGNATGAVDKAFNKVMESPAQRWSNVMNRIKNAGINLGTSLLPIVEKIMGVVEKFAAKLGEIDFEPIANKAAEVFEKIMGFARFIGRFIALIWKLRVPIIAVAAAWGIYKAAMIGAVIVSKIMGMVKAVQALMGAQKGMNAVQAIFNALLTANPIGLIIAGIAALIVIIVLLVKHWDKVKNVFIKAGTLIKAIFDSLPGPVKAVFIGIFNYIKAVVIGIKNIFFAFVNVVKSIFVAIWKIISGVFTNIVTTIKNIFGGLLEIWQGDGNFFVKIWNSIKLIFVEIWKGIFANIKTVANAFLGIWEAVKSYFITIWESVKNVFIVFWKGIFNVVKSVFGGIVDFVKRNALNIINIILGILFFPAGVIMAVVRLIIKHWDKIKEGLLKVGEGIKAAFNNVKDFIGGVFNKAKDNAGKALEGIKTGAENLKNSAVETFNKLKNGAGAAFNRAKELGGAAWEGIKEFGFKAWGQLENRFPGIAIVISTVFNRVKDIISGIIENIKAIFNGFKNFFNGLWGALKEGPAATVEYIKNAFFCLFNGIKERFFGFIEGIKTGAENLKNGAIETFNKLKDGAGAAFNRAKELGGAAWEGIKEFGVKAWEQLESRFPGLANVISTVFNRVKDIISGIIENIKAIFNGFKNFFTGLWESLKEGPASVLEYIKNAFFGLFDGIKEKFFGFIDVIKSGWESVKGFFSGITNAVGNVLGGNKNVVSPQIQNIVPPALKQTTTATAGIPPNLPPNINRNNQTLTAATAPATRPMTRAEQYSYSQTTNREEVDIAVRTDQGTQARVTRQPRSPNIRVAASGGNG